MKLRSKCGVCDKPIPTIIQLDDYPLTEGLTRENINQEDTIFDQGFQYCHKCNHGQLSNILDKKYLYDEKYSFRTKDSFSTGEYLKLKDTLVDASNEYNLKRIVDIGCNDGYLLKTLKENFDELIGIDPTLPNTIKEDNILLINKFMGDVDISLCDSLVVSHHVLEHIDNPKLFIKDLMKRSNDKTVFVFSFPSLDYLIKNIRFDQIFHHHLNYFSHHSIYNLLGDSGCRILNIEFDGDYWGSITIKFKKGLKNKVKIYKAIDEGRIYKQYYKFRNIMSKTNKYLEDKENMYCYGATNQFPILNYYIPNISKTKGIIDDCKEKIGLHPIGIELEIISGDDIPNYKDISVIITAINYSRDILFNLIKRSPKQIYNVFNEI